MDRRLFRMDFRDKVPGVWDESVPIVRQWILEGVGIHQKQLDDVGTLQEASRRFCNALGASIVGEYSHEFEPYGKTVIFLLSESHIAIHTWPEKRYIHVDIVTCKKTKVDIGELASVFNEVFAPSHCRGYSVKY